MFSFSVKRLEFLIKLHGQGRSLRSLSKEIGNGAGYLSNLMNDPQIEHPKGGPRLLPMVRLAEQLGISTDELAGRTVEHLNDGANPSARLARAKASDSQTTSDPSKAPTAHTLFMLYYRSGGLLEAFNDVLDYVDLYADPHKTKPEILAIHVGKYSMAGITMGSPSAATLTTAVNEAEQHIRDETIQAHIDAKTKGPIQNIVYLDENMSNRPIRVKMDYTRTILPLRDQHGDTVIMVYAVPLF